MEKELMSMSQQFSGLPMEDLIGAPLNAVAKANAPWLLPRQSSCWTRVSLKASISIMTL